MSEYRLQTNLSDETKSEMALHSEKSVLQTEIQNRQRKLSERFYTFTKVSSLLISVNVLLVFLLQRPSDFFVVIVYGLAYLTEIVWLMFGLRKRQRKLVEWQRIIDEAENRIYIN